MLSLDPPLQRRRKLQYVHASLRFPCNRTHQRESTTTVTSAEPGSPPSELARRLPKPQAFRYYQEVYHLAQENVTSVGNWVICAPTVQTSRYRSGRSSGEAYVEQSSGTADLHQPPSTSLRTKTTLGGCTLQDLRITFGREMGKGRLPRRRAGGPKRANRRSGV